MKRSGPAFETDYAYLKGATKEFANAHIALEIGNSEMKLIIDSDEMIDMPDVEFIVHELQNTRFKKMHIDLSRDIVTYLRLPENVYKVVFNSDSKISEMIEQNKLHS